MVTLDTRGGEKQETAGPAKPLESPRFIVATLIYAKEGSILRNE
jgi:hypothetical protein